MPKKALGGVAFALTLLACGSQGNATHDAPANDAGEAAPLWDAGGSTIGPAIQCGSPADGAMLSATPGSSVTFGGAATSPNGVANVTVNGAAATLSGTTFSANVTTRFGINFANVVATDTQGATSTRICSFLVADQWAPEDSLYADTIDWKLTQSAIDEGGNHSGGVHSLADMFVAVLNSPGLQGQTLQNEIGSALPGSNPIVPESCDQPLCTVPGVPCGCAYGVGINFLGLSLPGPQAVKIELVNGGLTVTVTLPNVGINLDVFGAVGPAPFDLSGWVTASQLSVAMTLDTSLSNGQLQLTLRPHSGSGSVGSVTTAIAGLDGWIIDHVVIPFAQGFIQNLVSTEIAGFITGNAVDGGVGDIISGLVISPFAASNFSYGLTSVSTTPSRMLVGIGSKYSAPPVQTLPSLGIAIPDGTVLDDMAVNAPSNTGVAVHVGVLNQALHAAWRAGMLSTTVTDADFGNGLLPPAAKVHLASPLPLVADLVGNSLELSFGALQLQVNYPGLAGGTNGPPLEVELGARLTSVPTLNDNFLNLESVTVSELHFSTGEVTLAPASNQALQLLLQNLLQQLTIQFVSALPVLPVPSFVIPLASQANLPFQLEPTNLSLGYDSNDFVLLGQLGSP